MIRCHYCNNRNLNGAEFCDECGVRLQAPTDKSAPPTVPPAPRFLKDDVKPSQVRPISPIGRLFEDPEPVVQSRGNGKLTLILKGRQPREFLLGSGETLIGRWDASTNTFPDIDLEQADTETKVSRRHARIFFRNNHFWIEDLGSLNGTIINRALRLVKGEPYLLRDGDEIIVGKSFLKFSHS